jgi:hypothetical protein
MADKDLFASLQQVAEEATGKQVTVNNTGSADMIAKQDIAKIKDTAAVAQRMYPDNAQNAFNYWKRNLTLDGMSNEGRNAYWKQYEQMHPNGTDGAKSDFINVTLNELNYINGVSNKEIMLRERIANSPPWAEKVLGSELAKYSTAVANANFSKANQVYSKSLTDRVNRFVVDNDLDPDVAIDQHTNDMLRMEQLNLGEVASVVNGRVGAYTNKGQFIPGFAIKDRSQIFPNDTVGVPSEAEQLLVRDTAAKPIKDAIETKIINQRSGISRQERLSAFGVSQLLESGHYPIDRWGEAFSANPESDPQSQIVRGLQGEISAGRIKQEGDLIESIYTAMNKYPHMFGDLNDTV